RGRLLAGRRLRWRSLSESGGGREGQREHERRSHERSHPNLLLGLTPKRTHTLSHENGHHFVGHQHSIPGEPQTPALSDEPSLLDERPQRVTVFLKDVD